MKKLWAVLGASVLALAILAGLHYITKQPPENFISRFRTESGHLEAKDFESLFAGLADREKHFLGQTVEFTSPKANFTASLASLGVRVDGDALQARLRAFEENPRSIDKLKLFFIGEFVPQELLVNEDQQNKALARLGIVQELKNASYAYEKGQLLVVPEQAGFSVNQELWLSWLNEAWSQPLAQNATGTLALDTQTPNLKTEDLTARLQEAEALAGKTYVLMDEFGRTWDLSLAEHMAWLDLDEAKRFTLKQAALEAYVSSTLSESIESEPVGASIFENPDGSLTFEGSARFGRKVQVPELLEQMKAHLEGPESEATVNIPVLRTDPELTVSDSLKARGITDLLSVGHSNFSGSSVDRTHNVNHGMAKFHASFIKQGEEFSFTSLMGSIDAANGWRPELVILGDKTEKEYGGGLCQVSSTMFRAALFSGLPITARKNHSYWVTFYSAPFGPGLDATVYDPNPNLKFLNDTPGDILIQGYTDGTDAYFVFYGTSDQRRVQMEGPFTYSYYSISEPSITFVDHLAPGERKLDQYAHTGFQADWYRTIFRADGTKSERENFHSNYEARPPKYFEGRANEETTPPPSA